MSNLDAIFKKRLERIREELTTYIDVHLPQENKGTSATTGVGSISEEKKKASVQIKFLNYMKLNDEDDGYYDDEEPRKAINIPEFFEKNRVDSELDKILAKKEESFSEMLLCMIDEKGLKDSDVYKRAGIDRRLFSKIRGDNDYVPSKKTAISFCLALQLEMDEANKLLATAGYTLSASSRFDLIIMYLIEKCEYNIHFANIVLEDYGEGTLSR